MTITTTTVFNIVALFPNKISGVSISLFEGSNYVERLQRNYTNQSYDTTTDEFQIVLASIQEGSAVVQYRFGDGSVYTPETLPTWLTWASEANPFSQSSLQVSTTPVTNNRIRFKNVPAHPDGEVVVYEHPNVNYPDEGALNSGLLQEGWWQHLALAQASGDPSTTIVIEMDTTETMTPILNAAGQITGYGFTVVINSIDSDAIRYSADEGETWTVARPAKPHALCQDTPGRVMG